MNFEATVEEGAEGGYIARCEDPQCCGHGLSSASALEALREEIRYRLELCPRTSVSDEFVELDIVSGL